MVQFAHEYGETERKREKQKQREKQRERDANQFDELPTKRTEAPRPFYCQKGLV